MAVNVTPTLEQVGLVPDVIAMETDGVTEVLISLVIELEVAVEVIKQVALDVITQLMISLLINVVELNVELLEPAFTPFTFH